MARPVLDEAQIHPAIRDRIAGLHADVLREVQAAVAAEARLKLQQCQPMRSMPFAMQRSTVAEAVSVAKPC